MKITSKLIVNLKVGELLKRMTESVDKAMLDVTVDIVKDVIKGSPKITGNNRRSISYKVGSQSAEIFSTSGYGGYLETGTKSMAAQPYFMPALNKNIGNLPKNIKANLQ